MHYLELCDSLTAIVLSVFHAECYYFDSRHECAEKWIVFAGLFVYLVDGLISISYTSESRCKPLPWSNVP